MKFVLILILCLIIFLFYKLLKNVTLSVLGTVICTLFIFQIIISPKLCIDSALSGAKLFFTAVFPSLFPFQVIVNMIMGFNGIKIYSKLLGNILCKPLRLPKQCSIVLVVSTLCGYPLGAKYTCELYKKGMIDLPTAQRLLSIATNASPLFVIGAIGTSMLGNSKLGYLLLISNLISCFLMGILIPANTNSLLLEKSTEEFKDNSNLGKIFKESIDDAVKTSLMIMGCIVIFSVITNIVKSNALFNIAISKLSYSSLHKEILSSSILGLLEMTNGCHMISSVPAEIWLKLTLISFMISFSGLSIISQVYSLTYKYPLSIKKYVSLKFLQGILCSGVTLILYKISLSSETISTINILPKFNFNNITSIYLIIVILLLLPACISIIIKASSKK